MKEFIEFVLLTVAPIYLASVAFFYAFLRFYIYAEKEVSKADVDAGLSIMWIPLLNVIAPFILAFFMLKERWEKKIREKKKNRFSKETFKEKLLNIERYEKDGETVYRKKLREKVR